MLVFGLLKLEVLLAEAINACLHIDLHVHDLVGG